jgi:hypothetical protein
VIVVRVSDTEYRAFAATCTHLDCIVEYRPEATSGRRLSRPVPRSATSIMSLRTITSSCSCTVSVAGVASPGRFSCRMVSRENTAESSRNGTSTTIRFMKAVMFISSAPARCRRR